MLQLIFTLDLLLLSPLLLFLSFGVIKQRRALKLAYGTSNSNQKFQAYQSAQSNFISYSCYCLIVLLFCVIIHGHLSIFILNSALLVVGRYTHAFGLIYFEQLAPPQYSFRVAGMVMTFAALVIAVLDTCVTVLLTTPLTG